MNFLEEILFYTNSVESKEYTSNDPNHIITFILLYVGYVYNKMEIILEEQNGLLNSKNTTSKDETYAMLVLQDSIIKMLPLNSLNDHETMFKLCGSRGRSILVSLSRSDFILARLWLNSMHRNTTSSIRTYSVHAEISRNQIDMTLNQNVYSGKPEDLEATPLLIKKIRISITEVNESIGQKLWSRISESHAISGPEFMATEIFSDFKTKIVDFICRIVRLILSCRDKFNSNRFVIRFTSQHMLKEAVIDRNRFTIENFGSLIPLKRNIDTLPVYH